MKKFTIIAFIALMVFALAGCGPGGASGVAGGTRVDVFWYTFADTYLASVRNAMENEARAMPHLRVTHHDCDNNQALQVERIQTAIVQGTDVLVVNIVTTGAEDVAMNIVGMARDAGLPVIFFNREVSDAVINSYDLACFVGTDADEAGYMQGEAAAGFLLRDDNWDGNRSRYDLDGNGEIRYIMLRGEHGNAEAFGRTLYAVQEANRILGESGRNIRLTPSVANETSAQYPDDGISNYFLYANWSAATAGDLMRTALTAHSLTSGAIELILANNDDAALGAIEAMNEEGFNTGRTGGYIPVFGVDATSVAMEAIRDGRMTGTILQDGEEMGYVILTLVNNVHIGDHVFANTRHYNVDPGVDKIRVPYAIID